MLDAFLNIVVILVVCFSLIWLFNRATCGVCKSQARLDGKTVLITGCTTGMGRATAFDIAKRGARLIMAGIDLELAQKVRDSIVEETKNKNVAVKFVDLSLMSSVREFAEDITSTESRIDVLIHNAAVVIPKRVRTLEGLNTVWATNYFGPFLLTILLIELIKRTEKSRIVFVSSVGHYFGNVDMDNPNKFSMKLWIKLYCDTKFAVTLFSNELARRLAQYGVTVNCLHPGLVYTPLWVKQPKLLQMLVRMTRPIFFKSIEEGAQTTIYLAVSEEVEGVSGRFFADCQEWPPARGTRDVEFAQKYWTLSEQVVQLRPSDNHIDVPYLETH